MRHQGVLQARVGSTRLPRKSLLPLGPDATVFEFVVRRLRASRRVDRWVLATTTLPGDDALADIARALDMPVFRGANDDVLDRTYECAKAFGMEVVVRAGADNPLLDPRIVDATIDAYERGTTRWDYFSNHHPPTFPDGQEIEIIPIHALEIAWREAEQPHEREHATPYLWDQPDRFRIGTLERAGEHLYHVHRWTLDYPEDYEFLRRVVECFGGARDFTEQDVIDVLARQPELNDINAMWRGDTWHARARSKIRTIDQYAQLADHD